jgi:hypothetical protein
LGRLQQLVAKKLHKDKYMTSIPVLMLPEDKPHCLIPPYTDLNLAHVIGYPRVKIRHLGKNGNFLLSSQSSLLKN